MSGGRVHYPMLSGHRDLRFQTASGKECTSHQAAVGSQRVHLHFCGCCKLTHSTGTLTPCSAGCGQPKLPALFGDGKGLGDSSDVLSDIPACSLLPRLKSWNSRFVSSLKKRLVSEVVPADGEHMMLYQ